MKNRLKNYMIPLIGIGILLSIMLIISSNFSKENVSGNKAELKTSSIDESLIGESTEKDEAKSDMKEEPIIINEKTKEGIKEEVKKEVKEENSRNDNVKKSIDLKGEGTYSDKNNTTDQKGTEADNDVDSKQTIDASNTESTSITGDSYSVKKGDTLSLIAQRANVSANHLKQLNNLTSDIIYENQTLKIKGTTNNSSNQVVSRGSERDEDLYWLSRIIHAESQGESYEGKVAVGNVIVNRVNNSKFPNTIKGVVFDKQDGYTQFSPVIDGTIYNAPNAESIKAATAVLNGERPVGNALYFLNPSKSTNFWIVNNRKYIKTIGLHDFYY